MNPKCQHIPDDELLLLADDELSSHRATSLRRHLADCEDCAGRFKEMKGNLDEFSAIYRDARQKAWESSGPRALLRARLAEEGKHHAIADTRWLHAVLTKPNLAIVCALALLTAVSIQALHRQPKPGNLAKYGPLPNSLFTPGSTRQATLTEICTKDSEEVVRNVPRPIEQKVFEEYGIRRLAGSDFEVDYLITPGLGGSDDLKNLWPEPHSNTLWNSYVKDQLEDRLHRMVCERKIPLEQAQRDIATDWISAYKKYFQTNEPLVTASLVRAADVSSLR